MKKGKSGQVWKVAVQQVRTACLGSKPMKGEVALSKSAHHMK